MIEEIDIHCIENDRYGFTLPYLYKIEKDANREKSIEEILEFFTLADKKYLISYCSELDEYVLGLPKRENAPIHMYSNFGNLHYDQDSLGSLESLEELTRIMIEEFQVRIDNQTFSKNIDNMIWE